MSELFNEIRAGKRSIDILEVMACPGGCTNGGGQPLPVNEGIIRTRTKALYDLDNASAIQEAHRNPTVQRIYGDVLGEPGSEVSQEMFRTIFSQREVLL